MLMMFFPDAVAEAVIKQLEDLDLRVEYVTDYSGRGMYGDKCVGFIVDRPFVLGLAIGAAVSELDLIEEDPDVVGLVEDLQRIARWDSMGLSTIVYFPGYVSEGNSND